MNEQDDYLWDGSGPPDPAVERLEKLLAPLRHDRPFDDLRVRRRRSRARMGLLVGALGVAAAAGVVLHLRAPAKPTCGGSNGFTFTAEQGSTVMCEGSSIASGVLPVGGVLDTGPHTANIAIANIGRADLGEGTRVRLEGTTSERHQLFLERGRIHAFVNAPPRLFAVSTASTQVVDLGCEYTIEVDATGTGAIEVQQGRVELESGKETIVVAPAGTHTRLLAGRKPSLPIASGADRAVVAAVADFEHGGPESLERLLTASSPGDAITIANLYVLVPPTARQAVLERLATFVPPPGALTIVDAVLFPARFESWRDSVVAMHLARSLGTTR